MPVHKMCSPISLALKMLLLVFILMKTTTVLAAPKHIVEEEIPFVWCDEDYPILDITDNTAYLADDIDDEYY